MCFFVFFKKAHLWLMFSRNDTLFFIFSSVTSENEQKIMFKRGNCFPDQTHKYDLTHFDLSLNPPQPKEVPRFI